MHRVARRGTAEVRQARAGDVQMRRIVVVDRRQDAAFIIRQRQIDRRTETQAPDEIGELRAFGGGGQRQVADAGRAPDLIGLAALACDDRDLAAGRADL